MQGKVVLITGASSGIGKALAYKFAKEGSRVMLAARNGEKLKRIVDDIKEKGGEAAYCIADVKDENDCKGMVLSTVVRFGGVDVLINNAGISMRALFKDLELNVLKTLMDVNFWGAVYSTKHAFPYILKSKGSIVAISSIAGLTGLPARSGYSSSKFALRGFMETLRVENLKTGVHVLMVYPGFTASNIRNTALTANGSQQGESPRDETKMMSAEEVANHVYKAVKKRKRSIILTAEGKITAFISKFFPAFMDKLVYNHMAKEPDSPFK
jgi:short-subunit dehydrogenase